MKTKEEIEIFAQLKYGRCNEEIVDSFCDGYTQCQEDMAKKIIELEEKVNRVYYNGISISVIKE